jgi:hypothetical protein
MISRRFILGVILCVCGFVTSSTLQEDSLEVSDVSLAFAYIYNVAIVRKSENNSSLVTGFSLAVSLTLPEVQIAVLLSKNVFLSPVACLLPLLPAAAAQSPTNETGECYHLHVRPSKGRLESQRCWGGEEAMCTGKVLLAVHMDLTVCAPQYTTFVMNASVQIGQKRYTTHDPFFLAFFSDEDDDFEFPFTSNSMKFSADSAAMPRVSLSRGSRPHLQLLDAVRAAWPQESCAFGLRLAQFSRALRYCSIPRGGDRNISVLWLGGYFEQLHPGIGIPIAAPSCGSVYAMDCDTHPFVSRQAREMIQDIDVSNRSHEWVWQQLPWCLSESQEFAFHPSPSFHHVYKGDIPSIRLDETSVVAANLIRTRGSASLAAMSVILNVSSRDLLVVRLDAGCSGWGTLFRYATNSSRLFLSAPHNGISWLANASLQFIAVLPVEHHDDLAPSSWHCAPTLRDLEVPSHLQQLLPLQAHLSKFYSVVSWDQLSASHISVTLMSRLQSPQSDNQTALQCSIGPVDVCDVCGDSEAASDCLTPQLLQYLISVTDVCSRLSPSCPGVVKYPSTSSSSAPSHKLILADNPVLLKLIKWSLMQLAAVSGAPVHDYRTVVTSHQTGAGLGNVWHSMLSAFLYAFEDDAIFFVNFESHPHAPSGRWHGLFSQAVDMRYSTLRLSALTQHWGSVRSRKIVGPGSDADKFWACAWGQTAAFDADSSESDRKVVIFEGGSFPLLALVNDVHAHHVTQLFSLNFDFYTSHFLISAAPSIRDASELFVKQMRSASDFIIGVRLLCVANCCL